MASTAPLLTSITRAAALGAGGIRPFVGSGVWRTTCTSLARALSRARCKPVSMLSTTESPWTGGVFSTEPRMSPKALTSMVLVPFVPLRYCS